MRTNPRPTPEAIAHYYPDNYGPYIGTQVRPPNSDSHVKKWVKHLVKKVFNFNTTNLPPLPPGRLLEVGCASGAFLHKMASQGWHVQGIEISEKAAQSAVSHGYQVHVGPLETAPEPNDRFDLIVGWMVLEHLHDPIRALQKLHKCAKPNAWLVLSVPDAGSLEFRIFKERWYALQLPSHLQHFTVETLRRVLEAGNWKLARVCYQRVLTNLIASVGYFLRDNGCARLGAALINMPQKPAVWSYALYPLAWLLSAFGQTGRMTIWARPKS